MRYLLINAFRECNGHAPVISTHATLSALNRAARRAQPKERGSFLPVAYRYGNAKRGDWIDMRDRSLRHVDPHNGDMF